MPTNVAPGGCRRPGVCVEEGSTSQGDAGPVVRVQGEADLYLADQLQAALDQALERARARSRVIVDLDGATYLDSSVISVLVRTERRLRSPGGQGLVVSRPRPDVYRVLELTGMTSYLDVRRV